MFVKPRAIFFLPRVQISGPNELDFQSTVDVGEDRSGLLKKKRRGKKYQEL